MAIQTSIKTPVDAVNAALVRIGHTFRVGSLYDGSAAAKAALDIYGQTRDDLLREMRPGFASRQISLTLQKTAPVGGYVPPVIWNPQDYPQQPWIFQYMFPDDALLIGSVRPSAIMVPVFLPTAKLFSVSNDNTFDLPQKVILCNVSGAIATYVGRVTDPSVWEASFAEALIASLARRLTVALADPRLLQAEASDENTEDAAAMTTQG
jgi:hypothetical protein